MLANLIYPKNKIEFINLTLFVIIIQKYILHSTLKIKNLTMPLPVALAAKLAKRGLYASTTQKPNEKDRKRDYRGVTACPNKSNIFHDCNYWCELHWKTVNLPDTRYMRNVGKLLQKYPLPHHWTEVFDKGMKRYYYWDMETDLVSWLPPKHPKAKLTESAAKLREKRVKGVTFEERTVYKADEDGKGERKRHSKGSRRDRDSDMSDRRHKYDDKDHRKRVRREDIIDPMDPAAYSDVPVGTWSDGLECNKADADSTASGALYQQRPYPAPGDILAANKSKSKR